MKAGIICAATLMSIVMAAFTFAQVLEPDTDRLGGDFATIPLSAPDPALCATACRADARCLAFTYVKPAAGTDGIARCALKSSVPTPYPNACCISGLNPNAPPVERPQVLDISTRDQVDLLGMDYRCFDLPSPELELCRQTCTDSELCDSFTYVRPVPDRPAARCCLKSGVPSPSLNACCTSGIVLRPPKQKPNLTVDGKAGVHPPRNEVEWQACEMARDVAEILAFSRSRKIPDEGVDVQVVGPASSEIIHLQIKTSPDGPAALASVRLAPFLVDASSLDEVVLATLSSLGIAPESVKGPPPPGLLERLTDFHARVIAQEARRVAEELDRRPLDPGLHEEAALCLASLAIKEQAGQFSDQRDAIRRGLVHLSLARGLRSPESLSTTGVVAEAALLTVAGRATSARRRLVGMNPAMGVAGLEAWRGALDELGSLDWRVNLKPVTGTLLQRTVHYRTLAARLGTIDAQDFIGSRNTLLLTEWPRAAFAHEWSVGFGNVFARSAPALEAAELVEVAKVLNVPVSTPPNLSALLDSSSQRCITRSSTGWRPEVIGWKTWSGYFQRHLNHALFTAYKHPLTKLAQPQEAQAARKAIREGFSGMEQFSVLWAQMALFTGLEERPRNYTSATKRDPEAFLTVRAFAAAHPEAVNLDQWRSTVAKKRDLPPDSRPPAALVDWFAAKPPGLAFSRWVNARGLLSHLSPRALEDLLAEAPTDTILLERLAERRFWGAPTIEQFDSVYAPVLAIDRRVMWLRAALLEGTIDAYRDQVRLIAERDPDALWGLGDALVLAGRDAEAVTAFEDALAGSRSPVAMANGCGWLVDRFWDTDRRSEARVLAERAAEVGSSAGLATQAWLKERAGNFNDAERAFGALRDRYGDEMPLQAFHFRRSRSGHPSPEGTKAAQALFPEGIQHVSLADFKLKPSLGVFVDNDAKGFIRRGVPAGSVIGALDGQAVSNTAQYEALRGLRTDISRRIILWDGAKWREVEGSFGLRYWDWQIQDNKRP